MKEWIINTFFKDYMKVTMSERVQITLERNHVRLLNNIETNNGIYSAMLGDKND